MPPEEPVIRETVGDQSFGAVVPYYDELMKQVPYRMWTGYYLLLLSHQDIHPKRVLDICCGTGTMCEMLTREGFELAGFDLAPGMIAEAKRKAERKKLKIRYEVQDAATAEMGETYGAAFSFFDSLNNILDRDRLQNSFHRAAAHLDSGGSFIFDLNTAYAFEMQLFDQKDLRTNKKLRYDWKGDYDWKTQIITVHMKFWLGEKEFEETHVQRAYDIEDVQEMLKIAGFERIRVFHSYSLNPPRHTSDRVHFSCVRP